MAITLSEELSAQVEPVQDRLPEIIRLGIRELSAQPPQFEGLGDIFEALARLPSSEEVLALQPSQGLQDRMDQLLEKNRATELSDEEREELRQYHYAEHLVRIAKARAMRKMAGK